MDKKTLDTPITFTPDQIKEVIGVESVSSIEDIKNAWASREKETIVEKQPFSFKDDYIKSAVDYYEKNGNLDAYIQNNVDVSTFSDEDLIRRQIKAENSGLSDKAIDRLTKLEMQKYSLEEDASDEDKELQSELLKVRADKIRNQIKEEQDKFKAPEKPSFDLEKWASDVNENESTKSLIDKKVLEFKNGDSSFNFEVKDPKSLVDMTIDNTEFFNLFRNKEGGMNLEKWYKVIAYAQNPELFEESFIKHGQSIGAESVVKDMKNSELGRSHKNVADAGLLQAFADRGVFRK